MALCHTKSKWLVYVPERVTGNFFPVQMKHWTSNTYFYKRCTPISKDKKLYFGSNET
jgi:hypothetical protein